MTNAQYFWLGLGLSAFFMTFVASYLVTGELFYWNSQIIGNKHWDGVLAGSLLHRGLYLYQTTTIVCSFLFVVIWFLFEGIPKFNRYLNSLSPTDYENRWSDSHGEDYYESPPHDLNDKSSTKIRPGSVPKKR